MKNTSKITKFLFICLIALAVMSCSKKEDVQPDTCKLIMIDAGAGNATTYEYANNRISRFVSTRPDQNGILKTTYILSYDSEGKLAQSQITEEVAGKVVRTGTEKYIWNNGVITQFQFEYNNGTKGVNNLKYDAQKQLIEFTTETGSASNNKILFEYDANGINTKYTYADLKGNVQFYAVQKIVGKSKRPEFLLTKYGLPIDIASGFPLFEFDGDVGTTSEGFAPNGQSYGIAKYISFKVNSKGFPTELSLQTGNQPIQSIKFVYAECD